MQLATAGAFFVKGMISVLLPAHKGEDVFTSARVAFDGDLVSDRCAFGDSTTHIFHFSIFIMK